MKSAAVVFSTLLCLLSLLPTCPQAYAEPVYAVSVSGDPALPPGFERLPYASPEAVKGGTLRLAARGAFDSFNPFIARGIPAAGLGLTHATLGSRNRNEILSTYGVVADSFEVSPDNAWSEFHLRPEAAFNDGHPVTAEDVVFTFNFLTTEGSPLYRSYYAQVTGVTAKNERTVRFTYEKGASKELTTILSQLVVLPKHYWEKHNPADPTLEPPLGCGPYRVKDFKAGEYIVYERVRNHWSESVPVYANRYNFDEIRYDYYRDRTVSREAFLAGEYDIFVESTAKHWVNSYNVPAVQDGRIIKHEFPRNRIEGMTGFVFNTRRPVFKNPAVRRAVSLAFDFEWTNKAVFYNGYKRCDSYFTNSRLAAAGEAEGHVLALLEPYRPSLPASVFAAPQRMPVNSGSGGIRDRLRESLRLLAAEGWTLKDGKMVNERGEQLSFTLLLNGSSLRRVALPFRKNLSRIGIEMDIRSVDQAQFINRRTAFDYDMLFAGWRQSRSPGNELRNMWSSEAADTPDSRNFAGIKDPVVDALIEKVVDAKNRNELVNACRAIDRVLLAGNYIIPGWYSPVIRVAASADLRIPESGPDDGFDYLSWWKEPGSEGENTAEGGK